MAMTTSFIQSESVSYWAATILVKAGGKGSSCKVISVVKASVPSLPHNNLERFKGC